jgi:hypothetical protein
MPTTSMKEAKSEESLYSSSNINLHMENTQSPYYTSEPFGKFPLSLYNTKAYCYTHQVKQNHPIPIDDLRQLTTINLYAPLALTLKDSEQ